MLLVRDAQMAAMRASLLQSFIVSVAAELHALGLGGAAAMDAGALQARTESAVGRALALGVETRDGLRLFALLAFDRGPALDPEDPAVASILGDRSRGEAERFEALCAHLDRGPGVRRP